MKNNETSPKGLTNNESVHKNNHNTRYLKCCKKKKANVVGFTEERDTHGNCEGCHQDGHKEEMAFVLGFGQIEVGRVSSKIRTKANS